MVPAWTFPRAGASLGRFCWSFAMARTSSESIIVSEKRLCQDCARDAVSEDAMPRVDVLGKLAFSKTIVFH
ncbi:hypothetical protein EPI10_023524 [Gossypium australe]|uniref:Uncharacterized protein n=1 Tax=Gossypium australe TaxID=47621 RepID=A0A5B6VW99_9ROSI|nr:hypothetical protein EPI10_023524 [Gossypium australe]